MTTVVTSKYHSVFDGMAKRIPRLALGYKKRVYVGNKVSQSDIKNALVKVDLYLGTTFGMPKYFGIWFTFACVLINLLHCQFYLTVSTILLVKTIAWLCRNKNLIRGSIWYINTYTYVHMFPSIDLSQLKLKIVKNVKCNVENQQCFISICKFIYITISKPKIFGAPNNLNQNFNFYPNNFVAQMIPYKSNM